MIELKNITKKYGNNVIFNNLNLTFKEGNIYCLKGISGSGKTTLLNIISGLDMNYSGECLINQKSLKKFSKKENNYFRQSIGYVMQRSFLYKKLTLKENLLMINNDLKKIKKLAKELNVLNILDKKPLEVSGGELQRIALIRALLGENKIIILDEPTSNLDHKNSIIFANHLKNIDLKDKIIIIATHKDIYNKISNLIININYGQIKIEEKNIQESQKVINNKQINFKKKKIIKSVLKLHHKQNLITQLGIIIIVCFLFSTCSFYLNYRNEYLNNLINNIPYNLIDITNRNTGYDKIMNNYNIKNKYLDYQYKYENINCYYYFPVSSSIIKQDDLSYGTYPEETNEVLVSESYVQDKFSNLQMSDIIGEKLMIDKEEYIIAGIIGNDFDEKTIIILNIIYNNIYNYNNQKLDKIILFNYNDLTRIGKIKDSQKEFIEINKNQILEMYEDNELNNNIFISSNLYDTYKNDMNDVLIDIWSKTMVSFIALISVLIIFALFLINELNLELFYRQKELGYLQLFHYTKDDISIFIIADYLITFIINILIGILGYIITLIYIKYKYSLNLLLSWQYILLLILIIITIFTLIIDIPLKKYLKKDIKELIV